MYFINPFNIHLLKNESATLFQKLSKLHIFHLLFHIHKFSPFRFVSPVRKRSIEQENVIEAYRCLPICISYCYYPQLIRLVVYGQNVAHVFIRCFSDVEPVARGTCFPSGNNLCTQNDVKPVILCIIPRHLCALLIAQTDDNDMNEDLQKSQLARRKFIWFLRVACVASRELNINRSLVVFLLARRPQ